MKIKYQDCIDYVANRIFCNYMNGGNDYLYDFSTTKEADLLQFIYRNKSRSEIGLDVQNKFKKLNNQPRLL